MTDPRIALNKLIEAFEQHYAVASRIDSDDEELLAKEDMLLDAFFTYDDALFTTYGVEIPIDLLADFFDEDSQLEDDENQFSDNEDDDYYDEEEYDDHQSLDDNETDSEL